MTDQWTFDPSKLKTLRSFKRLSPEALGRSIGKSRITIINWEKGRMTPTAKDIVAIANAFDIDPASFFGKQVA
ncbi:MAG: helix-turn-helix transcriptional regulator [Nitrospirota bacterium]|nr:helix-turn-helix transcriptional regulator [Nitrospirota bacterium]